MALLPKNPNEANYIGGKKHFTDVLKNRSQTDTLIYRNPEEDFNYGSVLTVAPGECAIFVNEGNIEAVLEAGRHVLQPNNFPFISRLRNSLSGGVSTFNCLVYFVRLATSREILWGTTSPIKVYDKSMLDESTGFGIETEIRSRGTYRVKVSDPALFLSELIGNNYDLTLQESLNDFFRNQFLNRIISVLGRELNAFDGPLNVAASSKILDFSNEIQEALSPVLIDYGLVLVNFSISAIDVVDNELRQEFMSRGLEYTGISRAAKTQAAAYGLLDTNYQQAQTFEMLREAARNEGGGQGAFMGAGMGLGMGVGVGQVAGNVFGQAMENVSPLNMSASHDASKGNVDVTARLQHLKDLYDKELISQEEYELKKQDIIKDL